MSKSQPHTNSAPPPESDTSDVRPGIAEAAASAADLASDLAADTAQATMEVQARLAEAEDRLLRAQADFENFRRRVRREQEDERRYAALPLLRDLLPVLDNLQLALEATGTDPAAAGLKSGIEMVASQFLSTLQQHGCVPLNPLRELFDPHSHDAVGREPTNDVPSGTVVRVERIGYRLHDRVVRPAAVVVAVEPQPAE
jgi:molecular chaperone GrpE